MTVRQIVRIDQELCDGCGICVTPCVEGAIALVDGKARVVDESLCDGAGFCLPVCPRGAISIEARDAPAFDEAKAQRIQVERRPEYIAQRCLGCGASEETAYLLPVRHGGQSLWICTRCLPSLIHG